MQKSIKRRKWSRLSKFEGEEQRFREYLLLHGIVHKVVDLIVRSKTEGPT